MSGHRAEANSPNSPRSPRSPRSPSPDVEVPGAGTFWNDLDTTGKRLPDGSAAFVGALPDALRDGARHPALGVLGFFTDAAAGLAVHRVALPDTTITVDLNVHRALPVASTFVHGPLVMKAKAQRVGARLLTISVAIHDGLGAGPGEVLDSLCSTPGAVRDLPLVAAGLVTLLRMPLDSSAASALLDLEARYEQGIHNAPPRPNDLPMPQRLGFQPSDTTPGVIDVTDAPYLHNLIGTVHGGVYCMPFEHAAQHACPELVPADLVLHYLSAAREPVLRTTATRLRRSPTHAYGLVDTFERASGRVLSTGPISSRPTSKFTTSPSPANRRSGPQRPRSARPPTTPTAPSAAPSSPPASSPPSAP